MSGPSLPISQEMHALKYRSPGETYRDGMNRVANALKDNEDHFHTFREILLDMRFWPGGRVQAAAGAPKAVTPYNCFVSGTIEDSFVDGSGSIMERAKEAAATMRQGGGIGYDFSSLRPKGDMIRKLASASSGPISFMEIFEAVCKCVASSGHRRGAQMGVLRVDHPDIEEFIHAKNDQHTLQRFNISVAVTDKFMECLYSGKPFPLTFGNRVYSEVDPAALWDALMRSTWDWAEPGVLFIDTINRMNNLWYCEQIAATNPCGEQPLPPHGACLLGSFNLVKYLTLMPMHADSTWGFDWDRLATDIPHVVRAMDNIVDRAKYPLYEQEKEAKTKRRMGLGVMGFANAAEAMGFRYGSLECLTFESKVLAFINRHCYLASIELAKEKGAFPLYDSRYLKGKFIATLDDDVREGLALHGIRNSHLTSIAPTGTISLCADNVSSGIEPVFAHSYQRPINTPDGLMIETVEDYGVRVLGIKGQTADQTSASEHVSVLTTAARHVDSAVSKTCNVGAGTTWEQFKSLYIQAYEGGAKGCTTFRKDGKKMALLTATEPKEEEAPEEGASCRIDPTTGRRECD